MKFGFGVLRLAPEHFWALTPRELQAAFAAINETAIDRAPLGREALTGLMRRFPDKDKQQ